MSTWTDKDVDRVLKQLDDPGKMFSTPKPLDALEQCSQEYTKVQQKANALFYCLWSKARAAQRALKRHGVEVVAALYDARYARIRLSIKDGDENRLYLFVDEFDDLSDEGGVKIEVVYRIMYGIGIPGSVWGPYKGLANATKQLYSLLGCSPGCINKD